MSAVAIALPACDTPRAGVVELFPEAELQHALDLFNLLVTPGLPATSRSVVREAVLLLASQMFARGRAAAGKRGAR